MKLYRTTQGYWAGTQEDAKALTKQGLGRWEAVEVSTTKAELLAILNECRSFQQSGLTNASHDAGSPGHSGKPEGQLKPAEVAESVHAEPAGAKPVYHHERDTRALQVAHDCDIEEAVGRADLPRTIALTQHVFSRLREHVSAAEALAGPGSD
jgi:hypothetical protein